MDKSNFIPLSKDSEGMLMGGFSIQELSVSAMDGVNTNCPNPATGDTNHNCACSSCGGQLPPTNYCFNAGCK